MPMSGMSNLFFERQQSLALRNMEWENRVEPLLPWSTLIVRGAGIAILASIFWLSSDAKPAGAIGRPFGDRARGRHSPR